MVPTADAADAADAAGTAGTADAAGTEGTDYRVVRGQRNRQAVVRALMELIQEGEPVPTAAQIAERAGVAVRSIYHHFADLESLHLALADEHFGSLADLLVPIPTDGPLATRLTAFTGYRSALFERAMPVYRASLLAAVRSPGVAQRIAFGNEFLRAELAQTFAIELRGGPPWKLQALDGLTSFDGWVRLRSSQGLDVDVAQQVLAHAIEAILAGSSTDTGH